jgi:hypothetical protein
MGICAASGAWRVLHVTFDRVRRGDVFRTSLLARSALVRLAVAALALVPLWLAIAWAVAVP